MEFLIDGEFDSNIQFNENRNRGDKNLKSANERRRNKTNPDVNSNAPVFSTKEQREKILQEDIKKKEEEEKKRQREIKDHLNEYLKSKYQDNSRKEKPTDKDSSRSRSNSRDIKKIRERSREREGHRREKDISDNNDKIINLQDNEKEEIKVKIFFNNVFII